MASIKYHLHDIGDGHKLVGFEVCFFPEKLSGYRVTARVSASDLVAMYRAGMLHTSQVCYLWADSDGRERKSFAKFWFRELKDSSGKFERYAFSVSSLRGDTVIEEEGFTPTRTEFSSSVFVTVRETVYPSSFEVV